MTLNEWLGLYIGIGAILAFTGWFRIHMMSLGEQVKGVLCLLFLWLPILVGMILVLLFWRHRPRGSRRKTPVWKKRREMNALKDKHGIDDAPVTARVIETLNVRRNG